MLTDFAIEVYFLLSFRTFSVNSCDERGRGLQPIFPRLACKASDFAISLTTLLYASSICGGVLEEAAKPKSFH